MSIPHLSNGAAPVATHVEYRLKPIWMAAALKVAMTALGVLLGFGARAQDSSNTLAYDQFFQMAEPLQRQLYRSAPDEYVDPFSGTLRIVHTDLVLPGKAGLDLRLVRSYSSDHGYWWSIASTNASSFPALPDPTSDVSGEWQFHMGRIRNPNASGAPTGPCSSDYPVLQLPDGTFRAFYRTLASGTLVSRDFWFMQQHCTQMGGNGTCVWSPDGIRYEFSPSTESQYTYVWGTPPVTWWSATGVVDRFGNRISVQYEFADSSRAEVPHHRITSITDTYNRTVRFWYGSIPYSPNGTPSTTWRLLSVSFNGNTYSYNYDQYGLLISVAPPSGGAYGYAYHDPGDVNPTALKTITYPNGARVTYEYSIGTFYAGAYTLVQRPVLLSKSAADRDGKLSGAWSYSYSSPFFGPSKTVISRPDGLTDEYYMLGFGMVGSGSVYLAGMTAWITRASGQEVEGFEYSAFLQNHFLAFVPYSAPVYGACSSDTPYDQGVNTVVLSKHTLARNGRPTPYTTTLSNWDEYGHPQNVTEDGEDTRTTVRSYFSALLDTDWSIINLVGGLPASEHVCVGNDCFDNSWTYNGPHFSRDSETRAGITNAYTYDADGNLSSVVNALGETLGFSGYVDGHGTPTTINYNNLFSVSRTTSPEGWVLTETNGRNYTTAYTYDGGGRISTITPPGNNYVTSYNYAPDGSSATATLAPGPNQSSPQWSTTYYDGFGRVSGSCDSSAVSTLISYDAFGRISFSSYPFIQPCSQTPNSPLGVQVDYDGLSRISRVVNGSYYGKDICDAPDTCATTYSYGFQQVYRRFPGYVIASTVQNYSRSKDDSTTTITYSSSFGDPRESRPVTIFDGNDSMWSYDYDAHGGVTHVTAPLPSGNRTSTFDPVTRLLAASSDGPTGTTSFGRNAIGQVTTRLTPTRGVVYGFADPVTGQQDPLNRLLTINYAGGDTPATASLDDVTLHYDNANNVKDAGSADGGQYSYVYDELNRLVSQQWTAPGGAVFTTAYSYDAAGCLYQVAYPTGTVASMTCDSLNRVRSMSANGSVVVGDGIAYDPYGKPNAFTYGNGVSTAIVYDPHGRATSVTADGVVGLAYAYDGANNVTSLNNSAAPNSSRTMTYDKLNRLSTVTAPYMWGVAVYDYDALGNRTLASSGSYTVNYGYDPQTGLLAWSSDQAAPVSLAWSAAGRLAGSSDGSVYQYDYARRRVSRRNGSDTVLYHYDTAGRVISETLQDGSKLRDYFYLAGKLVAADGCLSTSPPGCSEREWYHTDPAGTVLARTDANGTVTAKLEYLPWGESWVSSGAAGARQFNGRLVDPVSGLIDYGARYYLPRLGRFISPDVAAPDPRNPQSFNRYSYAWNNPYKYIDPSGREPQAINWLVISIPSVSVGVAWSTWVSAASSVLGGVVLWAIPSSTASWDGNRYDTYSKANPYGDSGGTYSPEMSGPREGSRPKWVPTGTRPIDQTEWSDDHEAIKEWVGNGPGDWTGITPDGHVITMDPQTGLPVDNGPASDMVPKGAPSGGGSIEEE